MKIFTIFEYSREILNIVLQLRISFHYRQILVLYFDSSEFQSCRLKGLINSSSRAFQWLEYNTKIGHWIGRLFLCTCADSRWHRPTRGFNNYYSISFAFIVITSLRRKLWRWMGNVVYFRYWLGRREGDALFPFLSSFEFSSPSVFTITGALITKTRNCQQPHISVAK